MTPADAALVARAHQAAREALRQRLAGERALLTKEARLLASARAALSQADTGEDDQQETAALIGRLLPRHAWRAAYTDKLEAELRDPPQE